MEEYDKCEEYSRLNNDSKSLLIGYYIAIALQKYYTDVILPYKDKDGEGNFTYTSNEQFCDDYIGFKYNNGYLRDKTQKRFYEYNYGKPIKPSPPAAIHDFWEESKPKIDVYTNREYINFMKNPNNREYETIRYHRTMFNIDIIETINKYMHCINFREDIIKKLWVLQEKWTEKTVDFIYSNLEILYMLDLKEADVFRDNSKFAEKLKDLAMRMFTHETGLLPVKNSDIKLFGLDGYSKRRYKRKSKRRSKRKSKRRSKRRSKRKSKRRSKRTYK